MRKNPHPQKGEPRSRKRPLCVPHLWVDSKRNRNCRKLGEV